ncbi:MAG TPA: Gfo/Idh/MocA family oxidoreductase [Gemmatimonadaceae bacterium]|nr:Gfo/Idh/MocA family oxidoreductase [Gemmatimonadaceae bacterium]
MSESPESVLVVGCGAIGRRHLRNLAALGVARLAACDPDPARRAQAAELGARGFAELDDALEAARPEAVLVCTPPALHVAQASRSLQCGAHVFVEKPLAPDLAAADALVALAEARPTRPRVVQVGYNLRFHPAIRRLAEVLRAGELGRPLWAFAEFGQYLPAWRPGDDFRASYSVRTEDGGGVLLDVSHELDYVLSLFGRPHRVGCMLGSADALGVGTEESASVQLAFPGGAHADVHVDFLQRTYRRGCRIVGSEGTASWQWGEPWLALASAGREGVECIPVDGAADMYMEELRHFLHCIATATRPEAGLAEGRAALRVALAARAAAASGRIEELTW